MSNPDVRGNPSASASPAAHAAVESALWRMMSFYDSPLADLDAASAADPGWALPHVMKAGFLLSLTEASLQQQAAAHLAQARALAGPGGPREALHLEAVQQLLEGRWHQACRLWDDWLLQHPRDALALQWAQLWDFYRGDAINLRLRPVRALPEWDEDDPLFPHVLALYAFGLEECNLHPQAEEAGRRALALDPRAPWAIHAVAHVMEMQGRFEAGSSWLRQTQGAWAEGNGLATHLWWHKGLFRLEALDLAGARRLLDTHLGSGLMQMTLQRVDAAALLWRLHLLGEDVGAPCMALLAGWGTGADGAKDGATESAPGGAPEIAGHYAFNDVHAVMTLLGAGELQRAESWVARCAERALAADDARRSNHQMAREVGLPLMRGLLALGRGQAEAAIEQIYPVRNGAQRFGGSHAQRDLIDQTLLAAAAATGSASHQAVGRALLNERTMAKALTPLTRHWVERLSPCGRGRA